MRLTTCHLRQERQLGPGQATALERPSDRTSTAQRKRLRMCELPISSRVAPPSSARFSAQEAPPPAPSPPSPLPLSKAA